MSEKDISEKSFSEEQLAELSDEEREALQAVDDDDDDVEEPESVEEADKPKPKEKPKEAPAKEEPEPEPEPEPSAEPAAEPEPEPAAEPEPFAADGAPTAVADLTDESYLEVPYLKYPDIPLEEYQAIPQKLDELKERYDKDEMSWPEYLDARDELKSVLAKVDQVTEHNNNLWAQQQAQFFKDNPELATTVPYSAISGIYQSMRNNPENNAFSNARILKYAAKMVVDKLGIEERQKADVKADAKAAKVVRPGKGGAPKAKAKAIPQTLGDVVSSDSNIDDEFAHIDNLSGAAYEAAFAKLTPEEQDRYLRD